ncbi:MAG: hypothetical protein VYC34_04280 [Planctomycetota bacterium]|nr:hypothetical protein [Planctomycetota bacterium]
MLRVILCAAVFAASATASADFLGIEIREDKKVTAGPTDLRVFNFYAKFDSGEFADTVIGVGQLDETQSIAIAKQGGANQGALFYQVSYPLIGGPNSTAPNANFFDLDPVFQFDSFVSIGLKSQDPSTGVVDATGLDSEFRFEADVLHGSWFNSDPPNQQGAGVFNSDKGTWETFIAQLSITGLDEGAALGAPAGATAGNAGTTWRGDIFSGTLFITLQDTTGDPRRIDFIPSPAPCTLLTLAALTAAARRRR